MYSTHLMSRLIKTSHAIYPSVVVTYPKASADSGPDGKMQQREDFKSVSCAVQNFMVSCAVVCLEIMCVII